MPLKFLKYISISTLVLLIALAVYLTGPTLSSFQFGTQDFPREAPTALDSAIQCRPSTIYVIKSLVGYADQEILDERCFSLQQSLMDAAEVGDLDTIRELIRNGANVNSPGWPTTSSNGFVPVWYRALWAKQTDAVKLLLDNGVNVNDTYTCCMTHESLLMIAVKNNDLDTMNF